MLDEYIYLKKPSLIFLRDFCTCKKKIIKNFSKTSKRDNFSRLSHHFRLVNTDVTDEGVNFIVRIKYWQIPLKICYIFKGGCGVTSKGFRIFSKAVVRYSILAIICN